jgi:hypothetical protein
MPIQNIADRHVDEHGLPEQQILIVVDRAGNATVGDDC